MDINNTNGSPITINQIFAYWVKSSTSQKIDKVLLNGDEIWDKSDPNPPSDIPNEGDWKGGANLVIPGAPVSNLLIQFSDTLQPTGYEVHILFDIGCQVIGTR
jgi:hypothetical protein